MELIIINPVLSIRRFFNNPAIPQEYRQNFIHLYFDIAWFGILSGSAINFLNIYESAWEQLGSRLAFLGLCQPWSVCSYPYLPGTGCKKGR